MSKSITKGTANSRSHIQNEQNNLTMESLDPTKETQQSQHENTCELTDCPIEQAEQAAERLRRLNSYMVDLSKEEIEPEPLYSRSGIALFRREEISIISGKAKSRKTFLVSLLCKEMLKSNPDMRIMLFDTEQGSFHVQKCVRRVHRLMGWNEHKSENDSLMVFKLRRLATEERKEIVEDAIRHFKPDFVFLDGVKDLIYNINHEAEATFISNFLMKLSDETNCHICSVLHENGTNSKLRGHVGTEFQNKCETVMSVKTKGNISEVSCAYSRNEPFEPFYFKVNDNGLPEMCEAPKGQTTSDKSKLLKALTPEGLTVLFNKIITDNNVGWELTKLREKVAEITGYKEAAVKKRIDMATDEGIIFKCDSTELYSLSSPIDVVDENDDEDTIDD